MPKMNEPKYKIMGDQVVNRQSGEAIPPDEPVFILRARDIHAVSALAGYLERLSDPTHRRCVLIRLTQFANWALENPQKMKVPDSELTDDWTTTSTGCHTSQSSAQQ